jgi:hypothetical protein
VRGSTTAAARSLGGTLIRVLLFIRTMDKSQKNKILPQKSRLVGLGFGLDDRIIGNHFATGQETFLFFTKSTALSPRIERAGD